jgi:flagellar protein FliS
VRLVICLYEQAIEDLRLAVIAQEKSDVESRTRGINHALTVIAHLEGSLDMERGGDVARNLARFYSVVRAGLANAQATQSVRVLEQQISQLATVHEAWLEVERATVEPMPQSAGPAQADPSTPSGEIPSADWNA